MVINLNRLIDFDPKYAAYTWGDLERVGLLGDEKAILELGRRALGENLIPAEDCECDCEEDD